MKTKTCTKCSKVKSYDDFHKGRYECKICRNKRNREYYKNNLEHKRKLNREAYQRRKDKAKEYNKEYYIKNKEKYLEYNKEWIKQNRERYRENQKKYREENREKINEKMKAYLKKDRQENKEKYKKLDREKHRRIIETPELLKKKRLKDKKYSKNLSEGYCRSQLKKSLCVENHDITKEMIDVKRLTILLKREAKNEKQKTSNTN